MTKFLFIYFFSHLVDAFILVLQEKLAVRE